MQTAQAIQAGRLRVHQRNVLDTTCFIKENDHMPNTMIMPTVKSFIDMYDSGHISRNEIQELIEDMNTLFMTMCIMCLNKFRSVSGLEELEDEYTIKIYKLRKLLRRSKAQLFSKNEQRRLAAIDNFTSCIEEMAIIASKVTQQYLKK